MTRRPAALVLGAALALCACSVDEHAEVDRYRSVLDRGTEHATVADAAQPLSVTDAMLAANGLNESLAIEGEAYLRSIIDQRRAVAAFLPTLTLAPSYLLRENTGSGRNSTFDTPLDAGLALNPVRDTARLGAAEETIAERRALLLVAQDALLIDVARIYYEVVRAERAVEVLTDSLKVQQERVSDSRARLEAGLVSPLDLSLSESQASQTEVDLIIARTRVREARVLLAFLTASDVGERAVADRLEPPTQLPPLEELVASAQRDRQDAEAAARRIDAALKTVESAYGQYFPSISLDLQIFLQRESEPRDLDWTSLIRLSLPLFSAGLIEADVRESLSLLREARLRESLTLRAIRSDVETAVNNLNASGDRVRQLMIQVRSAGDALTQSEGLYNVGLATNLERLTAQNALLSAELQLVNAELDAKVFYLDLLRTTGRLHELIGLDRSAAGLVTKGGRGAEAR